MDKAELCHLLAKEAKKLTYGMQQRVKRLPDTADYLACFIKACMEAVTSEPQASEPPKPEYQDATIYFDEIPEQGSNRAMIYIWPKPQADEPLGVCDSEPARLHLAGWCEPHCENWRPLPIYSTPPQGDAASDE